MALARPSPSPPPSVWGHPRTPPRRPGDSGARARASRLAPRPGSAEGPACGPVQRLWWAFPSHCTGGSVQVRRGEGPPSCHTLRLAENRRRDEKGAAGRERQRHSRGRSAPAPVKRRRARARPGVRSNSPRAVAEAWSAPRRGMVWGGLRDGSRGRPGCAGPAEPPPAPGGAALLPRLRSLLPALLPALPPSLPRAPEPRRSRSRSPSRSQSAGSAERAAGRQLARGPPPPLGPGPARRPARERRGTARR